MAPGITSMSPVSTISMIVMDIGIGCERQSQYGTRSKTRGQQRPYRQ